MSHSQVSYKLRSIYCEIKNERGGTHEIGNNLRERRKRTPVRTEKYSEILIYLKKPETADLVLLERCTSLLGDSSLLRDLCELSSIRLGSCTRWSSKKKSMDVSQLDVQRTIFRFHLVKLENEKERKVREIAKHTATQCVLNIHLVELTRATLSMHYLSCT